MAKTKKPIQADSDTPSLSFEGALDQLEQTVAQLEEGEMPLEAALELFESGVKLSRQCGATLEAAEKRIEILVADRADSLATMPFDQEEGDFDDDLEDDFDED
jgi:exodeoxyribonuclease VII small subunit